MRRSAATWRAARGGPAGARCRRRRARSGTVLIVTMWIMMVVVAMVLVLADSMRIEGDCSANLAARQQAGAIEQAAIQYVLANLDGLNGTLPDAEAMPCGGVQVGAGAFWIIRPDYEDGREQVYGLVDEASKVNLNTAGAAMLAALPEMTPEIAAALIDWRDPDGTLTEGGAEAEYYLLRATPHDCKNAPLETVAELLLVRDATTALLLGEDTNRNGTLDDNENDSDQTDPPDDRDGTLDLGLADLATVYSAEPNTDADGGQRTNVNQASTQQLRTALAKAVAENRLADVVNRARLGRPFQNIMDFYFRTGLTIKEFRNLADRITTAAGETVRGLINIGTAPRAVLLCLPGLDEADVSALITARSAEDADRTSIAWVAEALTQEKAVGIGGLITVRSYQFSANIVSVSGDGRAFRRCRIVVDATQSPPQVIYREDLTPLGWPLPQDVLDELRGGTPVEDIVQRYDQEAF